MKKKVLVIAPYTYLPFFSGGQKFIAQFLEFISKETELTVITTPGNVFDSEVGYTHVPLLRNSFRKYTDISLIKKITAVIKQNKYDAIIWEHPYYAWLAWMIKKKTGIQTLIHTHNIEYQRFRSMGKWWWPILNVYEKWFFKIADKIFFITPEDRSFAIEKWAIPQIKCIDLPFGVTISSYPSDKQQSKIIVFRKHNIPASSKILLFNGMLSYKPNLDALKAILYEINPRLLSAQSFDYKIIICGKGLPPEMNLLKEYETKNIIYAGFVDDIELYFKAADIFLNPVQTGGGIKTKMVEAIAYGTTVVATESGAKGIVKDVCGEKLLIVPDNDWDTFTSNVLKGSFKESTTLHSYYHSYYWGEIAKRVEKMI